MPKKRIKMSKVREILMLHEDLKLRLLVIPALTIFSLKRKRRKARLICLENNFLISLWN